MSLVWKPQPIEVYKTWVADIIEESGDILSSWETNFVDSIAGQLNNGRLLSEKQAEILESIYTKYTS